jgi:hypothetical protein
LLPAPVFSTDITTLRVALSAAGTGVFGHAQDCALVCESGGDVLIHVGHTDVDRYAMLTLTVMEAVAPELSVAVMTTV